MTQAVAYRNTLYTVTVEREPQLQITVNGTPCEQIVTFEGDAFAAILPTESEKIAFLVKGEEISAHSIVTNDPKSELLRKLDGYLGPSVWVRLLFGLCLVFPVAAITVIFNTTGKPLHTLIPSVLLLGGVYLLPKWVKSRAWSKKKKAWVLGVSFFVWCTLIGAACFLFLQTVK